LPSLKPCSAIIILTAIYFGRETGFMVGAFTALVSNFYFG
jgi:energy-coupling factor transport system substrate-specific component